MDAYSDDTREGGPRKSLNLRVDSDKFAMLEKMRTSGFGFAKTERNRSDIYNEVLGYGIQTVMLRQDLGEKEFDQLWRVINKMDLHKLNLDKIEELVVKE